MAHEDYVLRKIINTNTKPINKIPKYDIIVLDETQDMTLLYYRLVSKFIFDIGKKVLILTLGDKYQGIYNFKGADTRFLTLTPELWPNFLPMSKLSLQTSYRVTKPIAWFVNEVMLGEPRITSIKKSHAITYVRCNPFRVHGLLLPKILRLLKNNIIKPDDIFVLAGSVKSEKSPIRFLENALVSNGIECFVPTSDDSRLDEQVIKGKVIFTTFHQSKGRERKLVIIYGFDNSYFTYYDRKTPKNVCPSTLYVAVTRASERLFLLEDPVQGQLSFLKKTHDELLKTQKIKYLGIMPGKEKYISESEKNIAKKFDPNQHNTSPSDLIRFLRDETIEFIISKIDELFYVESVAKKIIDIPSKIISISGKYEDVSDLNGIIIPAMLEASQRNGTNSLVDFLRLSIPVLGDNRDDFLLDAIDKIKFPCRNVSDYLYLGNVYSAVRNQLYFKLAQINNYNWLTNEMVSQCHEYMTNHIGRNVKYEFALPEYEHKTEEFGKIKFKSIVDALNENILWEIKCVTELKIEHLLQLIIYAWIWQKSMCEKHGDRKFKIMNIRTGEVRVLKPKWYLIGRIINCLFKNKFGDNDRQEDINFTGNCLKHSNKFIINYSRVDTLRNMCNYLLRQIYDKKNISKYDLKIIRTRITTINNTNELNAIINKLITCDYYNKKITNKLIDNHLDVINETNKFLTI